MPQSCAVPGCKSKFVGKHAGGIRKSFYRIPAVQSGQYYGEVTRILTERRRAEWITAIGIKEPNVTTQLRVCSDHFISGKPAYLHYETDPDWVPSLHLNCEEVRGIGSRTEQHMRAKKRKRKNKDHDAVAALLSLVRTDVQIYDEFKYRDDHGFRDVSQEEIDTLCSSIVDLISIPDKSGECCRLMRQLFVILQASDSGAEPCIPHNLMRSMIQVASSSSRQKSSATGKKCVLCHMIIAELLSEKDQNQFLNRSVESEGVNSNLASLYLLQGKESKCLTDNLSDVVKWLQTHDFEKQKVGLAFLTTVSLLHGKFMDADSASLTSETIAQWLSSTSLKQAPNPHAINPFRKDEESSVTEIDGTPNTNIFTALNIGQYYTEDQLMNILSFSLLYKWLLSVKDSHTQDKEGSKVQDGGQTVGEDKQLTAVKKMLGSLIPKSVDYCFRVIDQCERKAKAQSDTELQLACLVEAVQVLDIICSIDKDQTARVFQEMKRLNTRLIEQSPHSPVLIYVLKFFFHHSTSVVHDPRETFQHYFLTVVSSQFKTQGLVYDTVDFLLTNLEELAENTDILTDYFPNLFKIVAWHPRIFLSEFCTLLPAMMNWDTSVEIFHLLLDLPCMTAALEVVERSKKSEPLVVAVEAEPASSLEAYYSPRFRPLFTYITRCESGEGDTIDRLANLHSVLRDCKNSTRVMVCCQLVPVLLKIWFETVLASEDPVFIGELLPVIIERSGLMFGVPELIQDVHKIFAEKLLVLCKAYPEIVTRQQSDIIEFLQTTANMAGRDCIYCNLIHAVGEHSSQTQFSECTSEVISRYYECLEIVTYELLNQLGSQDYDASIPKVVSALISALAKLASRCQDLIPRAVLCLTKAAKQQNLIMLNSFTKDTLTSRASSLIAILKNPDTASLVLSPSPEVYGGKLHLNNTSMASILRGMQRLIKD